MSPQLHALTFTHPRSSGQLLHTYKFISMARDAKTVKLPAIAAAAN